MICIPAKLVFEPIDEILPMRLDDTIINPDLLQMNSVFIW